jgi:monoterpene epsilon-lactone hydrolase
MPELPPSLWNIPERFISITHQLGRSWRRDVMKMTPEQIRAMLDGLSRLYPGQFGVTYEQINLGRIPTAKIHYSPDSAKSPKKPDRILFVHGGGFAFGSARTHRALATSLAKKSFTDVYIPDYGLAPERPFPAALNELIECYKILASEYGNIWLMGDSAGANLAAALLNEVIADNTKKPAGILLLSPWIDLRPGSNSNTLSQARWSPFERLDMLEYATHYLQGHPPTDPKASPILASMQSWPPVYLEASEAEYLWSDAEILAAKLREENIQFEFRVEKSALHAWQLFPDILPEAKRSIEKMAAFIASHS